MRGRRSARKRAGRGAAARRTRPSPRPTAATRSGSRRRAPSAAASTSPTVLRKMPGPAEHPVHGEVDVGLLAQRLVPGRRRLLAAVPRRERDRLDRLHGDAALGAQRRRAPRSRRRSARPASGRSCRAAAPSRTGSARGSGGASRATVSPWPVTPMKRTSPSSRASTAASSAPPSRSAVSHSITSTRLCSWIRSTWSTPSRSSERRISSRAPARSRSPGLRREEEPVAVLRAARARAAAPSRRRRGRVDVVDAVLEQQLERAVGLGLRDAPSAAAPKIVRVLSWPVLPNGAFSITRRP